MEEDVRRKINDVQNYLESAEKYLYYANQELDELRDKISNNTTAIKDVNNLKRELKIDGLYSEKLEDFLDNYMKYYNK